MKVFLSTLALLTLTIAIAACDEGDAPPSSRRAVDGCHHFAIAPSCANRKRGVNPLVGLKE